MDTELPNRQTYHITVHLWVDADDAEQARKRATEILQRGVSPFSEDIEVEEWDDRA